jgi:hypothetical protein
MISWYQHLCINEKHNISSAVELSASQELCSKELR